MSPLDIESRIENGKIVETCVAGGEVVAGAVEEVEDLTMVSIAAVAIMVVKIATTEVEVVVMMMTVVGEEDVVVIATDMTVTAADIVAPQVEDMEMDPSAQVDLRGMAYLLPHLYPAVVL
jgi:hypothetical protein